MITSINGVYDDIKIVKRLSRIIPGKIIRVCKVGDRYTLETLTLKQNKTYCETPGVLYEGLSENFEP